MDDVEPQERLARVVEQHLQLDRRKAPALGFVIFVRGLLGHRDRHLVELDALAHQLVHPARVPQPEVEAAEAHLEIAVRTHPVEGRIQLLEVLECETGVGSGRPGLPRLTASAHPPRLLFGEIAA